MFHFPGGSLFTLARLGEGLNFICILNFKQANVHAFLSLCVRVCEDMKCTLSYNLTEICYLFQELVFLVETATYNNKIEFLISADTSYEETKFLVTTMLIRKLSFGLNDISYEKTKFLVSTDTPKKNFNFQFQLTYVITCVISSHKIKFLIEVAVISPWKLYKSVPSCLLSTHKYTYKNADTMPI